MSGRQPPSLLVAYAPDAIRDLDSVWHWNEKAYGRAHAARYVDFLKRRIDRLSSSYEQGRTGGSRSDLRYIQIKVRSRGHGHVVVYRVDVQAVNVLHVFHTAQDWQNKLD